MSEETEGLGKKMWSPEELAAFLKIPKATLAQWRYKGTGPPYYKVGLHVRYRPEEVNTWLDNYP